MNILLKPNFDKPDALIYARKAMEKLLSLSAGVLFEDGARGYIDGRDSVRFGAADEVLAACDVVMPVGGDGTIMRAARFAAQAGKPILGINAGSVGFLTEVEDGELDALEKLFTGEYRVMERMMLSARVQGGDGTRDFMALNDVVVRHGDADRIVGIDVFEGEMLVASHRADGLIFSTPTGSTAYSMSAGGPIVSPELSLIVMTAICPHSTFDCALVLPPDRRYTVREKKPGNGESLYISIDGERVGKLHPGEAVTVGRSPVTARFIGLGLRDFYAKLNQKLSWRR